jgi:hypothetical protein
MISDNNFVSDSYQIRQIRLYEIQYFSENYSTLLEVPSSLGAWMVDCHTVYNKILSSFERSGRYKSSATRGVASSEIEMGDLYQKARQLALATYDSDSDGISDLGIDAAYPTIRAEKIERVENLLRASARHKARGVEYALPNSMISKLEEAVAAVKSAIEEQSIKQAEYREQLTAIRKQMASDTVKLRIILALWQAEYGKTDINIKLLGMVNPSPIVGRGVPPPPEAISFEFPTKLSWTGSKNATSYQVQSADSSGNWETIQTTEETSATVDGTIGRMYRVRARNVNGFGKFSEEIVVSAEVEDEP